MMELHQALGILLDSREDADKRRKAMAIVFEELRALSLDPKVVYQESLREEGPAEVAMNLLKSQSPKVFPDQGRARKYLKVALHHWCHKNRTPKHREVPLESEEALYRRARGRQAAENLDGGAEALATEAPEERASPTIQQVLLSPKGRIAELFQDLCEDSIQRTRDRWRQEYRQDLEDTWRLRWSPYRERQRLWRELESLRNKSRTSLYKRFGRARDKLGAHLPLFLLQRPEALEAQALREELLELERQAQSSPDSYEKTRGQWEHLRKSQQLQALDQQLERDREDLQNLIEVLRLKAPGSAQDEAVQDEAPPESQDAGNESS